MERRERIFVIFYVIIVIARREKECIFFLSLRSEKCESLSLSLALSLARSRYANCVFSFRCLIQLKSLEYNSLRFNVGRGRARGGREKERGRKGWTQNAYLHRERCNTHALEAIFSLPTRGYNVFLGTLINSIHFAQRFLITHCTEP